MAEIQHVAVVGLMATGKTTVGRLLAARLGWPFRDSDAGIERRHGRTVRELRTSLGTEAMHAIEADELLAALAEPARSVVAAAASVADDERCLAALRAPEVAVVWLQADPAVAATRFRRGSHRPWYGEDPATFLARQAADRGPRFRSLRPIEVDTSTATPDEAVAALLARLPADVGPS